MRRIVVVLLQMALSMALLARRLGPVARHVGARPCLRTLAVKVGDTFPLKGSDGDDLKLHQAHADFVPLSKFIKSDANPSGAFSKVLAVSLPGAFTPT